LVSRLVAALAFGFSRGEPGAAKESISVTTTMMEREEKGGRKKED
jgi:hypothetical protein